MQRRDLLHDPVGPTLLGLAGPMVLGIASIILFNVVDTFYVGQLGTRELAAMSFTFPVTFLVLSVSMGMGVGTTSMIGRAIGQGDRRQVRRLTTHALALANLLVVLFALGGLLTMDPVFRALGATPELMPLIREYMTPWYLGVGFLVIPMVGNSAIRATGDTRTPSYVMMCAGLVNAGLDPVLIFGLGPVPRMGLQGAAIATVLSWTITFVAALWVLGRRERMLELSMPRLSAVLASWKQVLYVGLPAAGTSALVPLGAGIVTRLLADHGAHAVAAFGVASRLEAVALIGINAMSSGLAPFVAQNFGAAANDRVRLGMRLSLRFSLIYGVFVAALLGALAVPLAGLFSDQTAVVSTTARYLWIVPMSYGLLGMSVLASAAFNALNRPLKAVVLIVFWLFVFRIPLALFGGWLGRVPGLFAGLAVGNALVGLLAYAMVRRFLRGMEQKNMLRAAP